MKNKPRKISGHFPGPHFNLAHFRKNKLDILPQRAPGVATAPGHFQETLFHQFPEYFSAFVS
jgi:hypothetical protein